jgi:hypothetical protein
MTSRRIFTIAASCTSNRGGELFLERAEFLRKLGGTDRSGRPSVEYVPVPYRSGGRGR